jgi:hypothetical protein
MPKIVDNVEIKQDFEGMLRRALERIIQLYTDKSHFVYELLQNAEDAGAKSIKFVQYADRLEVFHDGKPFTEQNLKSLCDIGASDKAGDLNQIGEFGVGFKSVFGICQTVKLYSEAQNYKGDDYPEGRTFAKKILDFVKPVTIDFEPLPLAYTTRFVFPFAVGENFSGYSTVEELSSELSKKLQNLGVTTLLFMKNLEAIEYRIETEEKTVEGQYLLEKKVINDHCCLASALGDSNAEGKDDQSYQLIHYLKFSRPISGQAERTVDIAFPVKLLDDGTYECVKPHDPYISVYFPTETESKLGFIVQGPYRTTPNRSSIPSNDKDNIRLANETATLLEEALLELRDAGMLNMSFIKALPLNSNVFAHFNLFYPLFEKVRKLFHHERIIPTYSGKYVTAKEAKIPRPERLLTLFSDELLTSLHADGTKYKWLGAFLTETNPEYEHVYRYLVNELKIAVIRPENLRLYFDKNPLFLPQRSNDWLVELYSVYENVSAAFAKNKNEANTLTCKIIKTTTGEFVSPCRRADNKQLIDNVFLFSEGIDDPDIHFVDPELYERCRDFFDIVLRIQKPNEYEFFIKDIRRRYNENYEFNAEKHVEDYKKLIRYYKHDEYRAEIESLIQDCFLVRCTDGVMRSPYMVRIYLSVNSDGIDIENYLKNIANGIHFVDSDFYLTYGINLDQLCEVGIQNTIMVNDRVKKGAYNAGREWWTTGDFCWKLSIEYIKDVLKYISNHPTARDSVSKSVTIFHLLLQHESKLVGRVYVGSHSVPNKENETCELLKILRRETILDWNGKWLYTLGGELVSPHEVTRYDISSKYCAKETNTAVFDLLGFKKAEKDELEEIKKTIPSDKFEALLEYELKMRFGLSLKDIEKGERSQEPTVSEAEQYPFPIARVKNRETLRKHAAEMLCFANPVKYEHVVRRIRISNRPKEIRSYLLNMYRYDGVFLYACQLCHDSCPTPETAEIFNKPDTELDPINLCLCPNCAAKYRSYRNNPSMMEALRDQIFKLEERELGEDYVEIPIGDECLWFTHIHFAEIQELLRLSEEVQNQGKKNSDEIESPVSDDEKSGMAVYSELIGKKLTRMDGFEAEVIAVDATYLTCNVLKGAKAGQETKIQISFFLSNRGVYTIKE